MNTATFRLRYIIAIVVSLLAVKDCGPGGCIAAFFVFNVIWTIFEEALIIRHNIRKEKEWKQNRGK